MTPFSTDGHCDYVPCCYVFNLILFTPSPGVSFQSLLLRADILSVVVCGMTVDSVALVSLMILETVQAAIRIPLVVLVALFLVAKRFEEIDQDASQKSGEISF